jgi:hypothetical protein
MKAIGEYGRGPTSATARVLMVATLALVLSCSGNEQTTAADGGGDAAPLDLCDAFTGVGTACPRAGPLVCFPMCEAGGCFCSETPDGPQWSCVTDRSCEQVCAPIDDACADDAGYSE